MRDSQAPETRRGDLQSPETPSTKFWRFVRSLQRRLQIAAPCGAPHLAFALMLCLVAVTSAAPANPVLVWNESFIQSVRKEMPPPCLVARNLAVLHLAIFSGIECARAAKLDDAQVEGAAWVAGHAVNAVLFPSQRAEHDRQMESGLKALAIAPERLAAARAPGEAAAARVLALRAGDGAATNISYIPNNRPGQYRRTPPRMRPPELPYWGQTQPFVLDAPSQFRPPPPPALNSGEYADAVNEVRRLGAADSKERTPEETQIARFWSDFSYTSSPSGHWNNIARELAEKRGLGVAECARLFAVMNVAISDAGVATWEAKYHYNFWRPITAIQRADEDDNPQTEKDAAWKSLLPSPPHPEYMSGHAAFSGAAAKVLAQCFGTDAVEFSATSDDVPGVTRKFNSLRKCVEEIARSRVLGGIHYSFSGRKGMELGEKVAVVALERFDKLAAELVENPGSHDGGESAGRERGPKKNPANPPIER